MKSIALTPITLALALLAPAAEAYPYYNQHYPSSYIEPTYTPSNPHSSYINRPFQYQPRQSFGCNINGGNGSYTASCY